MKLIYPAIAVLAITTMVAEEIDAEQADPNEKSVTVDIRDAEQTTDEAADEAAASAAPEADPPVEDSATDSTETEQAPIEPESAEPELVEEEPQGDPAPGLAVRVEQMQSGNQTIDPAEVRVLAPFPAKLLARSPEGWRIEASENAPHFTREVELAPGKHISLTVRPHVLVPDADGAAVFSIAEPGYAAPLGYHQNATVGAILSTSIRQLDKDAGELGKAIDQLQQLLVSLPKVEETPQASDNPPSNNNKRQR